MTKIKGVVLSIVFGLGICVALLAVTRTGLAQNTAPTNQMNQTKTLKAYQKEQKKQQKKTKKAQQKAQKKNLELHPA